jgi:hypothetical protein
MRHQKHRDLTRPEDDSLMDDETLRPGRLDVAEAVRAFTRTPQVASGWKAKTYQIPAGGCIQIASANRQRCRAVITTPSGPTYISPAQVDPATAANGYFDGYAMPSGTVPAVLELTHTGDIWASSAAGTTVSIIEEYAARDA